MAIKKASTDCSKTEEVPPLRVPGIPTVLNPKNREDKRCHLFRWDWFFRLVSLELTLVPFVSLDLCDLNICLLFAYTNYR